MGCIAFVVYLKKLKREEDKDDVLVVTFAKDGGGGKSLERHDNKHHRTARANEKFLLPLLLLLLSAFEIYVKLMRKILAASALPPTHSNVLFMYASSPCLESSEANGFFD
jgi:hypothetical protein